MSKSEQKERSINSRQWDRSARNNNMRQ